ELSQSTRRVGVSEELLSSLDHDAEILPDVLALSRDEHPAEPYRQKLDVMTARVRNTLTGENGGYGAASELLRDVRLVEDSLRAHRAQRVADRSVRDLGWRVETFGFHLAELDVRQESDVHG